LAYVRYLSVHQTFENLDEFQKRLGKLDGHDDIV
jgi:transcriptional regulator NrdR family protein